MDYTPNINTQGMRQPMGQAQIQYDMATNTCAITNAIQNRLC